MGATAITPRPPFSPTQWPVSPADKAFEPLGDPPALVRSLHGDVQCGAGVGGLARPADAAGRVGRNARPAVE
eukprot:785668-Alexandrium_andersonii.AAC.1